MESQQVIGSASEDAAESAATAQERLFAHCELGQSEELAALMQAGRRGLFVSCVNSRGETPLHVVRDVRCAELLLDSSGSHAALNRQNSDGETPLMVSLRLGLDALASLYLDNGADIRAPNKHFQSCLHVAARSGMPVALDRLLAMRQLDPNQPDRMGNAAVHYAVVFGDPEVACRLLERLLQEAQLSVDAEDSLGRTAFALAAQSGNLAACRLLRDRGCDLCHADADGADALHLAAASGSAPGIVRYLVSDLAFSVDRSDKLGRTALFYAVHHAAETVLLELLALGADPRRTDRLGRSPVHVAAEKGHETCLARLLVAGAQPWLADTRGQTPLHLAAANGCREVVKRLLRCDGAGDFLEMRDVDGMTARDLAGRQPQQSVSDLLTQAVRNYELQQQQQQRRSYPRPRSAAAKAREAEAKDANKRVEKEKVREAKGRALEQKELQDEREGKERKEPGDEEERSSFPRGEAAAMPRPVTKGDLAPENKHLQAEEEAKAKAEEADEFPSDDERAACYTMNGLLLREEKLSTSVGAEAQQETKSVEENRDQNVGVTGVISGSADEVVGNKIECDQKIKTDGDHEGPPQLELQSLSLVSTSASSLRKTPLVAVDSSATSSRPSSHLDEELHGDKRSREAEDRKHDPYLMAEPAWISGLAKSSKQTSPPPRLHRSKKLAPNIAALRQRLYMYNSTVMLGRVLSEERRERMLLRGGAHLPLARLQLQQPQQPLQRAANRRRRPTRPSTAADAERLSDRYRSINRETRQLLEKWKTENDSYGGAAVGSRPASGRGTPAARTPWSSGDQSGAAATAAATDGSERRRERSPEARRRFPAYRRPQSGSRFLDYFPNNRPDGGVGDDDGGDGRRGRAKSAAKSGSKPGAAGSAS